MRTTEPEKLPGLDQLADLGQGVAAARPPSPRLNATPCSPAPRKSAIVTTCSGSPASSMSRADTAPGDVEGDVDAVRCESADPLDETLAVGDRLGTQRAPVVVVFGMAVPITRAPRATASWTAALPRSRFPRR